MRKILGCSQVFFPAALGLQRIPIGLGSPDAGGPAVLGGIIRNPGQFKGRNLYGDIVSDVSVALVGGIGLVPGTNDGDEYAVFEAVCGVSDRRLTT